MKHRKMIEAFNLLKEEEGAQPVVREARWKQLVKLVAPDISNSHRELLLRISDDEQKGFIGEQWGLLCSGTGKEPGGQEPADLRVLALDLVCNGPRGTLVCSSCFPLQITEALSGFLPVLCPVGSSSWPHEIRPSSVWRSVPPVLSTGQIYLPSLSDSPKQCGFPHIPLESLFLLGTEHWDR